MIRRLLIANRGEIVCRIARTAHRMGIDTVGVYSDPDATALHVDVVDRAVALGGRSPAESYLRGDEVIRAAIEAGCDAIHPGYGFLAENADFARAVVEAGLVWVGPTPDQIALLGDKQAAKQAAAAAGVPTVGVYRADPLPDDVPMPVLIKAAAGGGGRGMRVVRERGDLAEAITAASREAESAFGDGTVFIEPYLARARHVEVQIMGDAHGSVVHLGERECSIQRRNQKVLEEAPSVGISREVRAALWEGALALAHHIGYRNAGTVEFLVGEDGTISFLEVNTRLQVEHPVTESITGLDLVELQLRVAAGEPLPIGQDDVGFAGHAIEARLVAEDPTAGWVPSTGAVEAFAIGDGVRVDTGVRPGSVVSPDYDSLLAKVIAHAPTREESARILERALRTARIAGLRTNREMLVATLSEPGFLAGATTTAYLAEHPDVESAAGPEGADRAALLMGAALARALRNHARNPWTFVAPGWRNLPTIGQRSIWRDPAGDEVPVEERWSGDDRLEVRLGPWPVPGEDGALGPDERTVHEVRLLAAGADEVAFALDGLRRVVALTAVGDDEIVASSSAGSIAWRLLPRFVDHDAADAGSGPVSPLPGTVIAVNVSPGDRVDDGDVLMVIEAMKMEHAIAATGPAMVVAVRHGVGDRVEAGDLLIELRHEEE